MEATSDFKVAPGAVRVWRGFRLPTLTLADFYAKLGSVFVPATVKFQIHAGLHSYTPTVPAGLPGKPDYVPDETAVLYWKSEQTYWNGFTRLSVRTYTLTHNGVYVTSGSPLSRADFPVAFSGVDSLNVDAPVFLFHQDADWMKGTIRHIVAERPRSMEMPKFKQAIAEALTQIQKLTPQLDGAVACIGDEYLVYWELGAMAPGVKNPVSGIEILQKMLTGWSQVFNPAPTYIPVGIYDEWPGMNVTAGSSFNMQFDRDPNFQ
jgi:hypothetical protein